MRCNTHLHFCGFCSYYAKVLTDFSAKKIKILFPWKSELFLRMAHGQVNTDNCSYFSSDVGSTKVGRGKLLFSEKFFKRFVIFSLNSAVHLMWGGGGQTKSRGPNYAIPPPPHPHTHFRRCGAWSPQPPCSYITVCLFIQGVTDPAISIALATGPKIDKDVANQADASPNEVCDLEMSAIDIYSFPEANNVGKIPCACDIITFLYNALD